MVVVVAVVPGGFFGPVGRGINGQRRSVVDELLLEAIGHRDHSAGGFGSPSGHRPCQPGVHAQSVHQNHVGGSQFSQIGGAELEIVGAYIGGQQALHSGGVAGHVDRPGMDGRQRGQHPYFCRRCTQDRQQAEQQSQQVVEGAIHGRQDRNRF